MDRHKKDESFDVSYFNVGLTQKAGGLLLYIEGGGDRAFCSYWYGEEDPLAKLMRLSQGQPIY